MIQTIITFLLDVYVAYRQLHTVMRFTKSSLVCPYLACILSFTASCCSQTLSERDA